MRVIQIILIFVSTFNYEQEFYRNVQKRSESKPLL